MSEGDRSGVRAIAFDWGGVFTEGTFDGRASRALAELYGVDLRTVEAAYFPLMDLFEAGSFDLPGFHGRLSHHLAARAPAVTEVDEDAFRAAFLNAALERPSMYELLGGIPAEYAVGMLSNNVHELCDRVRSDARAARIEHFVFSNEIGVRKPDASAFEALTEALGVPPEQTVFVDDNVDNVGAAETLGYRGLLFDTPHGFARRWSATVPDLAPLVAGPDWST